MKKLCALALCLALCVGLLPSAAWAAGPEVKAKAVLLMEKSTGDILYEEHGEEPLELASVTKVMTMLLIMEALEDGTLTPDTMVAVSANAAGMGGSQVYMKEGETFSVHDMLKAIAVASGPDENGESVVEAAEGEVEEEDEDTDAKQAIAESAAASGAGESTLPVAGPAPISHAEGKVPVSKRPKSEELKTPWADGRTFPGTGKNAPCPCGSGRKYKMCHGQNEK